MEGDVLGEDRVGDFGKRAVGLALAAGICPSAVQTAPQLHHVAAGDEERPLAVGLPLDETHAVEAVVVDGVRAGFVVNEHHRRASV